MTDTPTPEPGDEFSDLNRRLIGVSRDLEIARQRSDVLEDNLEAVRGELRSREQRLSQLSTENVELRSRLEASEQQLTDLRERISELLETNEDLRQQVEDARDGPAHVSVEDILTQFMTLRQFSPLMTAGPEGEQGPRVVLDNLDVELKGGISVREGRVQLSQIPGTELSPESASTLRFTLRTVPNITLITREEEEA